MKLVTREEWGALPPKSRSTIPLPVPRLWLHHSVSGDRGALSVRAIQRFHQGPERNWSDIGYSWLYSPRERTFYEGRGAGVAGAHTQGDNTRSHALCVLGNFDVETPAPHVVADLREFLAWHSRYGPSKFTGGHRDAPGAWTSCCGDNLHALIPTINGRGAVPTTLEDEDMSELVKSIQTSIKKAGGDPGPIDGIWGTLTQRAFINQLKGNGGEMTSEQSRKLDEVYRQVCEGDGAPSASNATTVRSRVWQNNHALGRLDAMLQRIKG